MRREGLDLIGIKWNHKVWKMKHKTTTYDMIRTIFSVLSNAMNSRKNQIYNASEIAEITKLDRTALTRHIAELEDLQIVDSFYIGNRKYYTLDKNIVNKIQKSGEIYFSDLMTQAQTPSESLNKDPDNYVQ